MKRFLMMALMVGLVQSSFGNETIGNQMGNSESQRRDSYINDGQSKLKTWQKQIDILQGKATMAPEQAMLGGQAQSPEQRTETVNTKLTELKADFQKARANLEALRNVKSEKEWSQHASLFEANLRTMDATYSRALAE